MTELRKFGRYEILEILGKGSMGMVYKAKDPFLDRTLALKTIRREIIDDDEIDEQVRQRFLQEAKIAGRLSHSGIVTIFDVGIEGEEHFIAMEFIEGRPLYELISDREYMTLSRTLEILEQICDAVSYAHRNNVIHRDLKPANIMVLPDGKTKIMDFGIARLESSQLTTTGQALGTPSYMSPEQIKGEAVDQRSDIFSLGVIFYQMLTGEKPFKGDTITNIIFQIINVDPDPPNLVNPSIPLYFDEVIKKSLSKEKEERFQTVVGFKNAIMHFKSVAGQDEELSSDIEATIIRSDAEPGLEEVFKEASYKRKDLKKPATEKKSHAFRNTAIVLLILITGAVLSIGYLHMSGIEGPWDSWIASITGKEKVGTAVAVKEADPQPPVSEKTGEADIPAVVPGEKTGEMQPSTTLDPDNSLQVAAASVNEQGEAGKSAEPGQEDAAAKENTPANAEGSTGDSASSEGEGAAASDEKSADPAVPTTEPVKEEQPKVAAVTKPVTKPPVKKPKPVTKPRYNPAKYPGMILIKTNGNKSFLIDKFEITNKQYLKFIKATNYHYPSQWTGQMYSLGEDDHPATGISWIDAQKYAKWAGKALPTIEQWQLAARGNGKSTWPWGNTFDMSFANCCNRINYTSSVGFYSKDKSPFGVIGMAGNVSEWTASTASDCINCYYVAGGNFKSIPESLSCGYSQALDKNFKLDTLGFRCVVNLR